MNEKTTIRQAAVAGMFYPRDKSNLEREIALFLENAPQADISGKILGLIVPHAGYMYSGGVAARAYRQIMDTNYDTVVVISPSHREYFTESVIYNGDGYATPLGIIPLATECAQKITDTYPAIKLGDKGHRTEEHALEVQLPFLQEVLGNFKLLPVMMGNQDSENITLLAEALADGLKDENALIVASTDLSHFYSYDKAALLDRIVVNDINEFNEEKLIDDLDRKRCEMCGGGPASVAMKAARFLGADRSKVLIYRNSGDVTGDKSQVVGYLSAIIYKSK
jgi:AmmeMemoRadiSam system protein B